MRLTRTWSPMSSVFSMEAEGISKFWKTKVMTKRPSGEDGADGGERLKRGLVVLISGRRRRGMVFSSGVVAGMSFKFGLRSRRGVQGIVYRLNAGWAWLLDWLALQA